jgi:hypothetical protein
MSKATLWAMVLATAAACGGGRTETAPYQDPHPLPEEPMVMTAPEIGAYGGRFVIAQTTAPRTFNHLMANETSSTDVTQLSLPPNFDNETCSANSIRPEVSATSDLTFTWARR